MKLKQIIFYFLAIIFYVRNDTCETITKEEYEHLQNKFLNIEVVIDEESYKKFDANISPASDAKNPKSNDKENEKVSVEMFIDDKNLKKNKFISLVNKELERRLEVKNCADKYSQEKIVITPSYPECFNYNNEIFIFMETRPYESIYSSKFIEMYNNITEYSKKFGILLNLLKKYEMLADCGIYHGDINLQNIVYSFEKNELYFINIDRYVAPTAIASKQRNIFEQPIVSESYELRPGYKKIICPEDDVYSLGILFILLENFKNGYNLYDKSLNHYLNINKIHYIIGDIFKKKIGNIMKEGNNKLSNHQLFTILLEYKDLIKHMIYSKKGLRITTKEAIKLLTKVKETSEYIEFYYTFDLNEIMKIKNEQKHSINQNLDFSDNPNVVSIKEDRIIL